MRRSLRLALLALLAVAIAAPARAAETYNAVYQAYVAGLNAVELRSQISFSARDYHIAIRSRTTGLTKLFWDGQQQNRTDGVWRDGAPAPREFDIDGLWRGKTRRARIAFLDSGPVIRDLEPPEKGRHPIAEPDRKGTLDPLSTLAALSRMVAETGRCDGQARIYDGRKLEQSTVRTSRWDILPAHDGSIYAGRALRCEVEIRLIGGFLKGTDTSSQQEPRLGTAWIASPAPGAPPLPVMFKLHVNWLGEATVFLTEFARGGSAAAN